MPSTRLDAFTVALGDWQAKLDADEWYFAHLRDELVGQLLPQEAFAQIDDVVPLLIDEAEEFPRLELGTLLLALAQRADTTEMPPSLDRHWGQVVAALGEDAQLREELCRCYRRLGA